MRNALKEDLKLGDWCRGVAWLLNSDQLAFDWLQDSTKFPFTGETVFHSNSHGELFGVLESIEFVRCLVVKNVLAEEGHNLLVNIINDPAADISGDPKWATMVGYRCLTFMYQCDPAFVEAVEKVFTKKPPVDSTPP